MNMETYILIIEDDHEMATLLEHLLAGEFGCARADSISAAQERFRAQPFDLIIADLNLPDGSSIQLLEKFRQAGVNVPFIIITGMPAVESTLQAMRLKVTAYLPKPFDFGELKQLVVDTIQQQRQMQQLMSDPAVKDSVVYARTRQQILAQLDSQWNHLQNWSSQLAKVTSAAKEANRGTLGNTVQVYLRSAVNGLTASLASMLSLAGNLASVLPSDEVAQCRILTRNLIKAHEAVILAATQLKEDEKSAADMASPDAGTGPNITRISGTLAPIFNAALLAAATEATWSFI